MLETVNLPKAISEIGGMAFMNSGVKDVYFPGEVELSKIDTTSFVQANHSVNIHVSEGTWMDQNFENFFSGPYVKCYE